MKPRPTRADVAAQAGVSKTTVTYVLSDRSDVTIPEGTRERVRIAASALGYRPHAAAKALASGRTNAITVAFPMRIGAHGARVLQAFERQANAHRCQLIASTIGNVQLENILPDLSDLLEGLTDGLILVDMPVAFQPYLDQAVPSSKPIVSMGVFTVPNMDSVQVEISQGIADAFEHLLQGGARRLAFLGPGGIFSDGAMAVFERDPRPLIYQQTMVQANRPAEFIPADPASRLAAVQSLTEHIAAHGCPDALFCFNDDIAISAYRALRALGYRIPEDVRVVGCDGSEEGEYAYPALSTISQPIEALCELAWEFLSRRLASPAIPQQHVTLQAEFCIRASSEYALS